MKQFVKYSLLMGLSAFLLLGLSTNAYACFPIGAANIQGPEGRCAVAPGIVETYTGTHNFANTGSNDPCLYYEWTVEGGVIVLQGGNLLPSGETLCIRRFIGCETKNDAVNEFDNNLDQGHSVDVIWSNGVEGKLELKVKQNPYSDLEAEITVDHAPPTVTSLSASANGLNSTTFTANLDRPLCAGQMINWTLNGVPQNVTGPTQTFNVGSCASGVVCAFTSEQVGLGPVFSTITTTPRCRSYSGSTLAASVTGPTDMEPNAFADYLLGSNQPVTGVTWSASPSTGALFFGSTTGTSVIMAFTNEGTYDVCATGTTSCGATFTRCLTVTVDDNGMFKSSNDGKGEVASTSSAKEKGVLAPIGGSSLAQQAQLQLQPNLVQAGQEINIALPVEVEKAQLSIRDLHGYQLRQKTVRDGAFTFSTAGLKPGVYLVTVQSQKWQGSKRFVVQ